MGFRLFGRGKDDEGEAACSRCGRTLLAGEWTQRLVDDDGNESYLCSLCVGGVDVDVSDEATFETTPAGTGKVRSSRSESDAFWRAIKDKDAEIERLESRLARIEAEKQELAAELARVRARPSAAHIVDPATGETPAASAPVDAADAPQLATAIVTPPSTDIAAGPASPDPGSTDPSLGERLRATQTVGAHETATLEDTEAPEIAGAVPATSGPPIATDDEAPLAAVPPVAPPPFAAPSPAPPPIFDEPRGAEAPRVRETEPTVEIPADQDAALDFGASLTILQRGVDLLNVSAVPRRIVETNDSLGIPTVHVGSEAADTLLVTFLWTMGWYQFRVELADGGRVTLAERGYDPRTDLSPNATVRADGTVQIAPTMIKQAAVDKQPSGRDEGPPTAPTTTSGTIISKSMMGQRTDDENVPPAWGTKNAPDFDWGR